MMKTLPAAQRASPDRASLMLIGLGVLFTAPAVYLLLHEDWRAILVLLLTGFLLIVWHINHAAGICTIFAYLLLLGDIRRIVAMYLNSSRFDPLLMVGAAVALWIFVPIAVKIRLRDKLSIACLIFLGIMVLEMVNPRQESLLAGLSAGLFYIVPILWFWIGRAFSTRRIIFLLMYRVLVPFGIAASILGMYQTYIGFLPWQELWIKTAVQNGYIALMLSAEHSRSFGFSVSGAEYVDLLVITALLLIAAFLAGKRAYALPLPIVLAALFLASERTAIVKFCVGVAAIWAVRNYVRTRVTWIPRLIFAVVVGFGGLFYTMLQVADVPQQTSRSLTAAQVATNHAVQGLAHPLDSKSSTAGAHLQLFITGIAAGFTYPVGYGLGAGTLTALKFGGADIGGSTEIDISDTFFSMGVAGGCCFIFIIILTFRFAFEFLESGERMISCGLIGILFGLLGNWLRPGSYAIAPFLFFCIGFLTKEHILSVTKKTVVRKSISAPDDLNAIWPSISYRENVQRIQQPNGMVVQPAKNTRSLQAMPLLIRESEDRD